jgi:lipase chaperone LimK
MIRPHPLLSRRRRRLGLAATLFVGLAALGGWALRPDPASSGVQPTAPLASPRATSVAAATDRKAYAPTVTAARSDGAAHAVPAAGATLAGLEARFAASSLAGTEVDGAVRFDADGRVLPDLDLRRRFDWYLALIGEFDSTDIRTLLAAHLVREHGTARAQRVLDVFDRYIGYLAAVSAAKEGPARDAAGRLDWLADARARHLGPELHAAFYADEERYARYTLERLAVARDPALDADQRARRLADLASALPEDQRRAFDVAGTAALAAELDAQHALIAADAATRHAERSALWGAAAAGRLAELDQAEAAWQARIDAYLAARRAVDADATLDTAARAAAVDALRRARFDDAEQRRIASLEAVGALASSND